ncbi:MAG: hypothetical protein P4L57_01695 [Rhizomicrobium sp.]|nr:hypothetical protein [Rhizomicrobium sp.]
MGKSTDKQSGLQRLADLGLTAVLMLPLLFAGLYGLDALERYTCPAGTFLAGSVFGDFNIVPLLIGTLSASALMRSRLLMALPALQEWLGTQPQLMSTRWAKIILGACVALSSITALYVAESQYCANTDGFYSRTTPWQLYQQQPWQDLRAIITSCSPGSRGSWRTAYVLIFRDATTFNLTRSVGFPKAYPALMHTLHGYDFIFDSRNVVSNCGYRYVSALTTRP